MEYRPLDLLLVGDSGVGKSPLMTRFIQNAFHEEWDPTTVGEYCILSVMHA